MKRKTSLIFWIISILFVSVIAYAGPLILNCTGSGGGSVDSVFGRTGTITGEAGDYINIYEPYEGLPPTDDYCRKSKADGTRSWGPCGTGGGTSYSCVPPLACSTDVISIDSSAYVPQSRTINAYSLTSNISLTYTDVGAAASNHTHTTTNISEGTNLYYTNARVKAYSDTLYSVLAHNHAYSSLTGLPQLAITTLCSGTDKMSAYNAATGAFTCSADQSSGSGGGDFYGPSSSTAGRFISFADTSGKSGADSGYSASSFSLSNHNHTGVYDPAGTASGLMSTHNSTYTHTDIALNTAARHSHTNKSTLDKITEGSNLPLWNGSTWPGGGQGVPIGGTLGQILSKNSNTDYDTHWINILDQSDLNAALGTKIDKNYINSITSSPATIAALTYPFIYYSNDVTGTLAANLPATASIGKAVCFVSPSAYAITFDAGSGGTVTVGTASARTFVTNGAAGDSYCLMNTGAQTWNVISVPDVLSRIAAKSSFSGSYTDLTNKPTLFSGSYTDLTNKPSLFSGAYADLTGKPSLFSGSYTDLSSKPSIPSLLSQLTDDSTHRLVTDTLITLWNSKQAGSQSLTEIAALSCAAKTVLGKSTGGTWTCISSLTFDDPLLAKQNTTPVSNPAAGYNVIYPKSNDKWYSLNHSGIESLLGGDNLGSATAADIIALFASGSCSGYLKSTGGCDTPSGGGVNTGTANQIAGYAANGTTVSGIGPTYDPSTKVLATERVSGQADFLLLRSSHSSDSTGAGFLGPLSSSGMANSYYLRLPEAEPTVGQILIAGSPSSHVSLLSWSGPFVPFNYTGDAVLASTGNYDIQATGNVHLFSGDAETGSGNDGGNVDLIAGKGDGAGHSGYIRMLVNGAEGHALFDPSTITADRTYVLPDKSGTIAMTSDISGSGLGNFSGPSSATDNAMVCFDGTTGHLGKACTTYPTFNQNTAGTAAGLTAQYIDWNASSGGASIANKPTLFNPAVPGAIGGTTPSTGAFTSLTATGIIDGLATITTGTTIPASGALTSLSTYVICTGNCTITPHAPAAGVQVCARTSNNGSYTISFAALGNSAYYEKADHSGYGTAGTGTLSATAAITNSICLLGLDSTHYLVWGSPSGTWTAN